jgi:hypothetical protein
VRAATAKLAAMAAASFPPDARRGVEKGREGVMWVERRLRGAFERAVG